MSNRTHGGGYYAQTDFWQGKYYAQADFALSGLCGIRLRMTIEEKLRAIMKATGWTQQEVAKRLKVSQSTVNRWLTGSEPEGHRRDAINEHYEHLLDEQETSEEIGMVPLVGYVGAGAEAHFYEESQGPLGQVLAPNSPTRHTVAVEVQGKSLGALFDRWLVYYDDVRSPITTDLIGRLCVVGLPNGKVLVKRIRKSKAPGLFHLESNTEGTIVDQEVIWAARVKSMQPR